MIVLIGVLRDAVDELNRVSEGGELDISHYRAAIPRPTPIQGTLRASQQLQIRSIWTSQILLACVNRR